MSKGGGGGDVEAQNYYYPGWYSAAQQNQVERGMEESYTPYQPYQDPRISGFTQDQTSSMGDILGMQQSPYYDYGAQALGAGANAAGSAVNQFNQFTPGTSLGYAQDYNPIHSNTYGIADSYDPYDSNALANLQGYANYEDYDPSEFTNSYLANQHGIESFTEPNVAGRYMNPYQQNVTDVQKREAERLNALQAQENANTAYNAGSFGGSRHGVVDANRERDQAQLLNDIQRQGSSDAWNAAAGLHGTERDRFLNVFQANEAARQAEAGLGLQAQQGTEQSRQFGSNQWLDWAKTQLGADQFDISNRINQNQFGLSNRLQAGQFDTDNWIKENQFALSNLLQSAQTDNDLAARIAEAQAQTGISGANTLSNIGSAFGNLGQQKDSGQMDIYNQQMGVGQMQQDLIQRMMDQRYADYTDSRDWEKSQMDWYNQLLGGMKPELSTDRSSEQLGVDPSALASYSLINSMNAKGGRIEGLPGIIAEQYEKENQS